MADKEVLLETTQNGNDEQLAITRPVDYIEQYRNAHKDLVMTGDDMARNYTYDPATWTPSQPKESRGRAIAMGLTDFATDIVETPQQVSQWATGGIVGLKKTFFPNMDETEFERTYRNVQRKMNKAAEARAEEIAKTGYPETYEWTNAISNLALLYIPTGFIGANIGAIGATSAAAAKSIAKGLGVTARQAKNIAKGAKKGAEVAVGTLAGVQTTGQLSQEFAQQYASDTGDVELKNYNPSKDASLSALLGVVSGFVNSKLDVSRYAGRFNSEKSITKALEQGLRGATEEFVEESIESITQDIGRIASGYQYDLSLDDVLTNALTNGIMGAVLGGVAGAGLYSINRARMVKWYTDKGLTEDTAKKVTDQMLTEGRSQILDQINTNYELATKNGEAYTKVKDIYQKLLENVGSKNSVELADTYARMTADWLTMHADQYGLPTSLFIDANEAMDNMVALRQFTSQDVKDRITELKTTLVHQKNIGEASNPDIVADAKRKLRVLQKVDTINTNKENARMKALDLKIAKTQGLYDKIESAWNKPSAMGTTEEKLAYLSNGNKNTFKKTMVYAPAKVKNGLAQVADKVNEPIRASIANALGKLDSVNKENFIDSVSNSISNTDSTLDNTMLYMMLFEDQATLSNFTSLYADKTEKDVNLSSKDAIGQSLKEIDELKQISNPNYQSKFGSNGEMLDPNMLAAFMSYQNQYQTLNQTGTYDSRTPNIYYQIGYASLRGELVGDSLDAERFEGIGEGNSVWAWGNYLLKSQALDKKYYYDTFNSDSNTRVLYNEEPLSDIFKNELVRNTITSGIKHGLPYYKLVKNLEESYESSGRTRLTIGKESIINTIKNPNDYESSTKMYNINADIIKNNPKEDSLKLLDKIYEMAEYGTSTVKGSEISAKYQDNEVFKALRQLVTNEYGGLDNLNLLINNIKTMREDIDKFKSLDFEKFSGWLGYRYDGKPIETDVSIIIDKNTPVLIDSRSDMILVRSKTLNEAIKKLTDIHTKESQRINSELSDMEQDAENYSFKGIFKIWKESALLGTNTRITENIKAYDDFIKANELQFGSKSKNKEDLLKLYQAFPEIKLITELIDDNIHLQHDIDYLKTLDPTKFEHKKNASMYEFDVPEDKYLLDFKKPLNKQSVYIQKALAKLYEETKLGLDPVKTIFKTSNLLPINLKAEDILPNPLSEDDIIATYEDVLKGFVFTWNNSGLDVAKNDLKSSIDNMEKNLRDGEVYFINNFTDYLNVKKFVKTITDKIPEDAQISDYFIRTTSMDSEINGERLYTSIEKDIDLPQYRYTLAKDLGALDKEGYTIPQKATSKLLERYGVKGVKYNGKRDKQGFVTFGKTPMIRQLYQLQTSESNKDVAYTNKSADVINMLGNLRNPVRFMFDETNKQWIIGKGDSLVHDSMWRQAYKDGMLDFKSESDAIDYFNLSRYEDKNIHSFVALPYSNNDFMTPMHEFGDDYQYMYVVPTNNTDGFIVLSRQPNGKDLLNSGLDKVYNSGTLYNISSEYKPELVKESTSQYTWDSESPALFQRNAIGGWYDPELATIALGRNFNELTLAHELAHHWLTQYFNLYKQYKNGSLKATDAWAEDAERLFSLIGIDPNQDSVTREQQEKWATMNEAYLTGFVPEELKNNISYRDFQRWIPEKYKSILQIGYLDQDNNVINPILSESDIEFFNKWYAHPDFTSLHVQPEAQKWAEKATSTKVMNDREKTIAQDWEEQESGIKTMDRIRNDNIPTDLKAAVDAEEVRIHNKDSQEIPNLPEHKSFSLFGAKNAQERMADIARNYVQKNIEHAKEIAMANPLFVENDTGVDREFLILAVIEHENYQMGSPEYAQLMHNAARTRQIAGSTLGLHNTNSFKWYIDAINQIEETLENKAAINYAGKKRNAVNIYNADIERFVLNKVDSILATAKESKERDVALAAMFAEAKTKFSGNVSGTALTQLDLTGKKATRANKQAFIEWAKREIKRRAGVDITSEMQVELLQVSQKAQQAETELDSQDEAKAIAAAKTIREWQNKVNSYKKTDKGKVGRFFDSVFGEYAPRAMLFSPSTLLANIPGNVINGLITSSVNKVYGKNKVSQEAQKAEIHRLKQISRATGMNFATMEKPTSPSILHGEKYKQTTGAIKAIDPFTYLSETDNLFRIPIFVDTLARIATKHAEEQGVSPTELFRQYCKLHNEKGSVAQQARLEAIEIGNIAVFTQNGMLAKMANKIRDALNVVGTGNVGLGNLISPFVKTPANIVEMGARAIAFPVTGWKTLLNWNNATDKAKFDFALDGATLALSALATVLMSALQDDREWYAEPYESGKYDSNKPYDSIRFGNAWIRLDQFGTLMLPMQVGAKLVKDLQDGKAGAEIAESTGWQVFSELLRQTPVIDTFQENSMKWAATHPGQYALNYAYNQANKLIPAWGKQIARPTLRESGIVLTPESKIGKRAVRNYGLDGQDNTINDWLGIIYGRLKVEQ